MKKAVLIGGASKGVGRAAAHTFAAAGYDLALTARSIDMLQDLATELHETHGIQALPIKTDMSDEEQIEALIQQVTTHLPHLNVVLNIAGLFADADFANGETQQLWKDYVFSRKVMQDAPTQIALLTRDILTKNKGTLINLTSDAGLEKKVYPGQYPYIGAKAALNQMTAAWDVEVTGPPFYRALAPGNIDTPLLRTVISKPEIRSLVLEKYGTEDAFWKATLTAETVAEKLLDIAENPTTYHAVTELPSSEF